MNSPSALLSTVASQSSSLKSPILLTEAKVHSTSWQFCRTDEYNLNILRAPPFFFLLCLAAPSLESFVQHFSALLVSKHINLLFSFISKRSSCVKSIYNQIVTVQTNEHFLFNQGCMYCIHTKTQTHTRTHTDYISRL